jgi:putative tricarboxylic transport membrane protein
MRKVGEMMKKADQITGIIVLIFSGFVIEESWRMPHQALEGRTVFAPWMGFVPFWMGVFLAILSILLIANAWLRPADPKEKAILPNRQAQIRIVLLIASLAAYFFLLEVLGYLVSTLLLNAFLLRFVMQTKWGVALLLGSGASVSLYVIFQVLLNVGLPINIFGF